MPSKWNFSSRHFEFVSELFLAKEFLALVGRGLHETDRGLVTKVEIPKGKNALKFVVSSSSTTWSLSSSKRRTSIHAYSASDEKLEERSACIIARWQARRRRDAEKLWGNGKGERDNFGKPRGRGFLLRSQEDGRSHSWRVDTVADLRIWEGNKSCLTRILRMSLRRASAWALVTV